MIWSLLTRFGPALIPAVIGAVPAFAAGWFAHGVEFNTIDRPAIIRETMATANDACTIRTMVAAQNAEQAERLRQRQVNADVVRAYEEALRASEAENVAIDQQRTQEIADYEKELAAADRTCPLNDRDIEWLMLDNQRTSPATSR